MAVDEDVGCPKAEEEQADVAVDGEESGIDTGEIVRLHQAVFIGEQQEDGCDAYNTQDAQMEGEDESRKTSDHCNVQSAGDQQRTRHAEAARDAAQSFSAIEFKVLAGVNHVEACGPEHDRGSEPENT